MALKHSSAKLLAWLFQPEQHATHEVIHSRTLENIEKRGIQVPDQFRHLTRPFLEYSDLPLFFPELSQAGQRSLVSLLKSQLYLEKSVASDAIGFRKNALYGVAGTETVLYGTGYARDALKSQFPVFSLVDAPWQGGWTVILFLDSPKSDPQFRYLRSKLIGYKAALLKPGVYLYPGTLPEECFILFKQLYVGSVVVWQTDSWRFGDERQVIMTLFNLSASFSIISGISNNLYKLLASVDSEKGLTKRQKETLFLVFSSYVSAIGDEVGILPRYFPQVDEYAQILCLFQLLYLL